MWKRLWVVLAFCLVLLPEVAFAGPVEGLANGFDDLVNPKVTEQTVEEERETEGTRAGDDSEGGFDYSLIRRFFNTGMQINWAGNIYRFGSNSYLGIAKLLAQIVLPVAVLFVFFWWGLRKSWSIIKAAWQKGKARL